MDKESKMFLKISGFKKRARNAPSRRLFKHLQKYPNIPIAQYHVKEYRKSWPQDPESMSVEAVLCLSQNQPHKALKLLNQATDLRPDIGKLWSNKAVAYVTLKRPQDALNCANLAIQYTPDEDPTPYNIKGIAQAQLMKKDLAIRTLRHSLFLEPNQAKTHRNLASIYSACSMTTDAMKHYKSALQIDPYFDAAYPLYTRCLIAIGKTDEAMAVMEARSKFYEGITTVKPVDHATRHPVSCYKLPTAVSPGAKSF